MSTWHFAGSLYLEGRLEDPESLVSRTFGQPPELFEEAHNQLSIGLEGKTEVDEKCQFFTESKRDPDLLGCIIVSFAAFLIVSVLIFSLVIFAVKRTPLEYGLSITIICCIAIFCMFSSLRWRKSIRECIFCCC